jgi:hypothetical protein
MSTGSLFDPADGLGGGVQIATEELLAEVGAMCSVCEPVGDSDLKDFARLLTPENDPRNWGLKAERQRTNDCRANSGTSAIEVIEYHKTGKVVELSRMFYYQQCELIDRKLGADSGVSVASGVKVARELGSPTEVEYPYSWYTRNRQQLDKWARPVMESASTRRIHGFAPMPPWATMIAHVASGQPVDWATHWPLSFEREPETGRRIARRYRPHGGQGHAHLIVWAMRLRTGQWVAVVWNSHGDEYFLVTEEFYEEARNPRMNPFGGYVILGEEKPIEKFYNGQFHMMG